MCMQRATLTKQQQAGQAAAKHQEKDKRKMPTQYEQALVLDHDVHLLLNHQLQC